MANIVIGYKNLCLDSGVTFTPDSENFYKDADNLGIAHPAECWRIDTLTGDQSLTIAFGQVASYRIVAPLYTTASPHRSLIRDTFDLSDSAWTETNITATLTGVFVPGTSLPICTLQDDATNGEHNITQKYSNATLKPVNLTATIYMLCDGDGLDVRMTLANADDSALAYVDIDQSDGSVTTSSQVYTNVSASSSNITGDWYRVTLNCTKDDGSGEPTDENAREVNFTIATISSGVATYVGSGDSSSVAAPLVEFGSNASAADDYQTGQASFWTFDTPSSETDFNYFAMRNNMQDWYSARGWTHSFFDYGSTGAVGSAITLNIYDTDNEAGYLDVGALYVGPAWQPTRNVADGWQIRPAAGSPSVGRAYGGQEYRSQVAEPRELTLRLGYESPADAFAEAHNMGIKVGQHTPILVIIDPDEDEYAQEQTIYGTLTDLTIGHLGWYSDRGDGTAGARYEISMTVRELLP